MSASIAKLCDLGKLNFATPEVHSSGMGKPVNQVVAEALRFYMGERWNQSTLGKAAGVAPGTVKNCLYPEQRDRSASGKEPSVKLGELNQIAQALGVHLADLVTDTTDEEREKVFRRRAADHYAEHGVWPEWAPQPAAEPGKSRALAA